MGNQVIALILAPPACRDDQPQCENHSHEDDGFPGVTACSLRLHHHAPCVSRGDGAATVLNDLCTDPGCRYAAATFDDLMRLADRDD